MLAKEEIIMEIRESEWEFCYQSEQRNDVVVGKERGVHGVLGFVLRWRI